MTLDSRLGKQAISAEIEHDFGHDTMEWVVSERVPFYPQQNLIVSLHSCLATLVQFKTSLGPFTP
jgi:hypothetical protein